MASVLDLHTRKVFSYAFGRNMMTKLIKTALQNAYDTQHPGAGLIFHSDLGSQYTSEEFACLIHEYNMEHSFSYKSSPYVNVCIESFHAILKKEEVNHVPFLDKNSAKIALFRYIES